jgi:hypothetical protein
MQSALRTIRQKWDRSLPRSATARIGSWFYLGLPLVVGLCLRIYAIGFGSQMVLFGDEEVAAQQASDMVAGASLLAVRPNGWLYYLINAPVLFVLSIIKNGALNPRLVYDVPIFDRVVAGRAISVVFGVATIVVIYFTGKMIRGKWAGLCAALVVALSPTLVVETHLNVTTAPLVFWMALTIYFLVQARSKARYLYFALGSALLAFLTKPMGVVALALVALCIMWRSVESFQRKRAISLGLLIPTLVALGGVGLVALTRWQWLLGLIKIFLWQYDGMQPVYAWVWLFQHEGGLLLLGLVGIFFSRLDRHIRWPLVIIAVLYSLGSLAFKAFYVRWLLLLIPVVALFAGEFVAGRLEADTKRVKQRLVLILPLVIFLWTGEDAYALVHNLDNDVRVAAWAWIRDNVPPGARIAEQGNWVALRDLGQAYRFTRMNPVDDPQPYVEAGINYVAIIDGGLDYYNWRAASPPVDTRKQFSSLYNAFELVHEASGTILHIPLPMRIDILRVPNNPAYAKDRLVLGAGWNNAEMDQPGGPEFRWMTDRGSVFFDWSGKGGADRVLSFDEYTFPGKSRISVYTNGKLADTRMVGEPGALHSVEVPITLAPGLNEIVLVSEQGCERPIVIEPKNPDTHCMSIRVTGLSLKDPANISPNP